MDENTKQLLKQLLSGPMLHDQGHWMRFKRVQDSPATLPTTVPTKRPSPLRPLAKVTGKTGLSALWQQANYLMGQQRCLRQYLPPQVSQHVRLQRLDSQGFVIEVDNSAWAARLRFQLPQLQRWMQNHQSFKVPKPRLRVRPAVKERISKPMAKKPQLSRQNAQHLRQQANICPDPRLRAALYRLANHCTDKDIS